MIVRLWFWTAIATLAGFSIGLIAGYVFDLRLPLLPVLTATFAALIVSWSVK